MPHLHAPDAGASPLASSHLFDVTIIGAGPVGLFAAFYAGLRQMTTKVIDSLEELGGQLTALYPEKFVFDVAGFPKIYARDLAKNLIDQAMEYRPTICLGETVKTLTILKTEEDAKNEPPEIQGVVAEGSTVYRIASDKGSTDKGVHYTRTVIIAAGAGAFAPRKLTLKEAPALENHGLYYSCKSKAIFNDKRVLIAGGGDSAIDWALNLRETAKGGDGSGITLIHRSNKFRAHEDSVRKLQVTKTKILTHSEIESIIAEKGHVKAVNLFNKETKQRHTLEVDAILVQFGFISSLGAIKDWPIHIEKSSIRVSHVMETALPGVFAVGDVATFEKPEAKLKLIVTGFGEAAIAVCIAKTRIDPHAKIFPGHSSEMTTQAESIVTV